MYDADGKRYLDAYNNVPHVGHCHPRVVAALSRQAGTLNTHTRYLDENLVAYAERLVSLVLLDYRTARVLAALVVGADVASVVHQQLAGTLASPFSNWAYVVVIDLVPVLATVR